MEELEIRGLEATVNDKKVLNGVDLSVSSGSIHILMGPNGSGKSSLANIIMGNPKYFVVAGSVKLDGEDLLKLKVNERAKKGIFLAFQEPVEIPGVNSMNFLMTAYSNLNGRDPQLRKEVTKRMEELKLPESFLKRPLFPYLFHQVGISGLYYSSLLHYAYPVWFYIVQQMVIVRYHKERRPFCEVFNYFSEKFYAVYIKP